jgi:transcription initiation factor TFIIIB Brf1 subunit/transcription initiation factor TFIIB
MNCPRCQSENTFKNGRDSRSKRQMYVCKDCKRAFTEQTQKEKPKVGITLDEFREKHDVEYIITNTLSKLDSNLIYEKADIVKLAGISYNAQGLTAILESKKAYYGKTGGKTYYSHPDTINMLKEQAKLN